MSISPVFSFPRTMARPDYNEPRNDGNNVSGSGVDASPPSDCRQEVTQNATRNGNVISWSGKEFRIPDRYSSAEVVGLIPEHTQTRFTPSTSSGVPSFKIPIIETIIHKETRVILRSGSTYYRLYEDGRFERYWFNTPNKDRLIRVEQPTSFQISRHA